MEKERPIWDFMGVPYRDEAEFESGQIFIDTVRHREPLELALKMNQEAEVYYDMIWGDKDTFRFAFHKYGRPFSMVPWPLQLLSLPGMPVGSIGAMCQHDFEGNRIFQHRNMAKWDLLAENPRIPGYLYEDESREFLQELRALWNGRLNWAEPKPRDFPAGVWKERKALVADLIQGNWLLDDRRPAASACCGPPAKWKAKAFSKPWQISAVPPLPETGEGSSPISLDGTAAGGATAQAKMDPAAGLSRGLRCREVAFASDSTLRKGASPEAYWWDLETECDIWVLYLVNEKGRAARMTRSGAGAWMGRWLQKPSGVVGLKRVATADPFLNANLAFSSPHKHPAIPQRQLHVANHANGIGDAITGLYAAAALAGPHRSVVYHTRFSRWLKRAAHAGLSITGTPPPKGAQDMDVNYAEQLRYAPDKVKWYAGLVHPSRALAYSANGEQSAVIRNKRAGVDAGQGGMVELQVNCEVGTPRLDFAKYVILAPFAAWEARDWPETHWRRLAWLLKEAGYEIVAIGTKKEAERMERTFNKSYAYWAIDHDPEWVMDAMMDAAVVIGLDSGMIHVAGLLGVPTLCIHSHLPPEFLFSHAPTVKSVTPSTGCVFCRWQEDCGFMEGCGTSCSALATVGPEAVMGKFIAMLAGERSRLENGAEPARHS